MVTMLKSSPSKREYQQQYRTGLKRKGLCLSCHHPLRGKDKTYVRCSGCRAKDVKVRREKVRQLREKGLCICGKPIVVRDKDGCCEDCWFKSIAKNRTGSPKNWLLIKGLLQRQNYRCAYTDKELVIGRNASLDHIIPKSKGGDSFVENLQWVDLQINVMKNNLSHREFITIIKLIIQQQSRQASTKEVALCVS